MKYFLLLSMIMIAATGLVIPRDDGELPVPVVVRGLQELTDKQEGRIADMDADDMVKAVWNNHDD